MAFRRHRVSDGPQRLSLRPERDNLANSLVLGVMRTSPGVAAPKPKAPSQKRRPSTRALRCLLLLDDSRQRPSRRSRAAQAYQRAPLRQLDGLTGEGPRFL
jgi:hypothetical protein